MRDYRYKESIETIRAALVGNFQPEHVFALKQAIVLYDFYQRCIDECDVEIERTVAGLNIDRPVPEAPLPKAKHRNKYTRKTSGQITVALRLAVVTVGRIGNARAVIATARKIAVLFYNAMRYAMDYRAPGEDHYEQEYRDRVIKQLHRRASQFG